MNDTLHTAPPLQPLFERLALKSHELVSTTAEQRAEKIRRLLKSVMDARPQILEAGRKELKLQDMDIDMQLLMVKTECEFVARNLGKWMGRHPVKGSLMSLGKKSYVQYEPKGVVLNLATWNAPIAIGLVPLLGAIAAGNTCVLKPSELAPLSAQVLAEIVAKAFPSDEFAVVQGGPEVASELLKLPFNHIFFIGGHAVGRLVMRAAAEHFASVTLEMGGKNPTIIDASADLADSARKIAWGRVANCGQVCLAPDYALVHESIQGPFVQALGKAMHALYDASGEGFRKSPRCRASSIGGTLTVSRRCWTMRSPRVRPWRWAARPMPTTCSSRPPCSRASPKTCASCKRKSSGRFCACCRGRSVRK